MFQIQHCLDHCRTHTTLMNAHEGDNNDPIDRQDQTVTKAATAKKR
jgi:hypothetical protein